MVKTALVTRGWGLATQQSFCFAEWGAQTKREGKRGRGQTQQVLHAHPSEPLF